MSQSLLKPYHWEQRVLLVFDVDDQQQSYKIQQEMIEEALSGYQERDLVVFSLFKDYTVDPNGGVRGRKSTDDLRRYYGVGDRDFLAILIGKDGSEKLRSDRPLSGDLLFPVIDAMPMRRREMRTANHH